MHFKSIGWFLKNVIISCKGVIQKYKPVNCESKNLPAANYQPNNLRVNPSSSCELYQFAHTLFQVHKFDKVKYYSEDVVLSTHLRQNFLCSEDVNKNPA